MTAYRSVRYAVLMTEMTTRQLKHQLINNGFQLEGDETEEDLREAWWNFCNRPVRHEYHS